MAGRGVLSNITLGFVCVRLFRAFTLAKGPRESHALLNFAWLFLVASEGYANQRAVEESGTSPY